jgi:hypothetical protein
MVWNEACQQWAAFTTLKPDRSEKKKGAEKKKRPRNLHRDDHLSKCSLGSKYMYLAESG